MHWIVSRCLMSMLLAMLVGTDAMADDDRFIDPPYGATPEEIKAALRNCASNQISMNICAWSRYNDSESALTAAVADLSAKLSFGDQRQALATAHDEFKRFRNATCAFEVTAIEGGSLGFAVVYRCRSSYNSRRIKGLTRYGECLTNERSCEVPFLLFAYENSRDGS